MALEFARFQATSHSRIMGQPRLQRVVMTGLAFEGEGPHKAVDYFARSPLYPNTLYVFDQSYFTQNILSSPRAQHLRLELKFDDLLHNLILIYEFIFTLSDRSPH